MLVNLYRSRTPVAVFSLPLFVGLISASIFFTEPYEYVAFFQWETDILNLVFEMDWFHYLLVVVLTSLTAHQLNTVFNKNGFFNKATFLPGLIYVLGLSSINQMQFSFDMVAHLFLVFALGQMFSVRRQEDARALMFKSGLFAGIAISLSPLLAPFLLMPWVGLVLFRAFVWREWALVLIGLLLPLIYHISFYYLIMGQWAVTTSTQKIELEVNNLEMNIYEVTSMIYLTLIALYCVWKLLVVSSTEVVRFKKQTRYLFLIALSIGIAMTADWLLNGQLLYAFSIPAAIVFSIAFLNSKNSMVVNIVVLIWFIINTTLLFL